MIDRMSDRKINTSGTGKNRKILNEKFYKFSEGFEVGLESWSRRFYQPTNIRSSNYLKSEKNSKGEMS